MCARELGTKRRTLDNIRRISVQPPSSGWKRDLHKEKWYRYVRGTQHREIKGAVSNPPPQKKIDSKFLRNVVVA